MFAMLCGLERCGVGLRPPIARHYSRVTNPSSVGAKKNSSWQLSDSCTASKVCKEVSSVNTRLEALSITSQHLSGRSLLHDGLVKPLTINLPSQRNTKIENPTTEQSRRKTFIQEQIKAEISEPSEKVRRIEELMHNRLVKHCSRMVILRRKKMRKHQRKRLWDRMYLKFRASKAARTKRKELAFRHNLATKIEEARKFNAAEYVTKYLEDFHTPITPGTYKGKRLPQWLILELLEEDKQKEKEKRLEGKMYTTKETIVKSGETVDEFIQRTWK